MARQKSHYVCTECGYQCAKWLGKCPDCGSWNTLTEVAEAPPARTAAISMPAAGGARVLPLKEIPALASSRTHTGIRELDRVLGGGMVKGSVVLVGGEPGIGKSTLFLQAAEALAAGRRVLYVSGEESGEQVKLRAERLGLAQPMLFLAETQLELILGAVQAEQPDVLVVDSIQTIYRSDLTSAPGSVSQVRECAAQLARMAKQTGMPVFLIGHVTKDGAIAGPRVLEHLVDTVLYFEGERNSSLRILRAVKNRFGSTNEIGVFEMSDRGMIEVENPSAALLTERERGVSGSCVFCAVEGTRPVLLEVEALVSETPFGMPRRQATGVDAGRMSLIVAVLEKKIGLKLYNQDIFVNVGGGIRLVEPALDLAVAASIVSSFRNRPVAQGSAFFGEIGLTGELRAVSFADRRIAEVERMGFSRMVLPQANLKAGLPKTRAKLLGVRSLGDALAVLFE